MVGRTQLHRRTAGKFLRDNVGLSCVESVPERSRWIEPQTETDWVTALRRERSCEVAKRRVNKYPPAFRKMALERMRSCANVSALAEELGMDRTVLCLGGGVQSTSLRAKLWLRKHPETTKFNTFQQELAKALEARAQMPRSVGPKFSSSGRPSAARGSRCPTRAARDQTGYSMPASLLMISA